MYKKYIHILGILLTIIFGSLLYSKFCCEKCCEKKSKEVVPLITEENKNISNAFSITAKNFEYSCDANFNFSSNEFEIIKPVDICIEEGIVKLKAFLDKNPKTKLKILGYSTSSEKNNSVFPNLGFARANDVKNYLISKVFFSNQFEINGKVLDNLKNENGIYIGSITYMLTNDIIERKGQDWNSIKEKINATPLTLYFNTNQSEIILTETERQKVLEILNYLDNVKDSKVNCIGHSDNVGNRNLNIQLGQSRANFVKDYLIKNGISTNKIEANSKGPDTPIAENLTPEGRAKNRRTIITIK